MPAESKAQRQDWRAVCKDILAPACAMGYISVTCVTETENLSRVGRTRTVSTNGTQPGALSYLIYGAP